MTGNKPRRRRPLWRIHYDFFWLRVFAILAGPGRGPADRYEINDELMNVCFELAGAYRACGLNEKADSFEHRGVEYSSKGTPPEPRPAAAVGMPVPQPYTRTELLGQVVSPAEYGDEEDPPPSAS